MMTYFWSVESDIPAGAGFEMHGTWHLLILAVIFVSVWLIGRDFPALEEDAQRRVLCLTAWALPVLEVCKICFLTLTGHMGIGFLPLHLCSASVFLYPVVAMHKNEKVRGVLSEICLITLLPAAVSALLFPDWTMYPVLSFMNLHAFLWHGLQVLFPILCLRAGIIRPSIRHLWYNTAFLLAAGLPVYVFDRVCFCNYWFLLWPVPGTPLAVLWRDLNAPGYVLSLLLLASAANLCMYGVLALLFRKKS